MSTELKPVANMSMTRYYGKSPQMKRDNAESGEYCVQFTQKGQHVDDMNPLGMGYVQMNKAEAMEMAMALLVFCNDTREVE